MERVCHTLCLSRGDGNREIYDLELYATNLLPAKVEKVLCAINSQHTRIQHLQLMSSIGSEPSMDWIKQVDSMR